MAGVITGVGTILRPLEGGRFEVEMHNGHRLLGHWPKKVDPKEIPLLPGDKVLLEMSPYDLSKGRISSRQPVVPPFNRTSDRTKIALGKE